MNNCITIPGNPISYKAPCHGRGFTYDPIAKKKKEVKEIVKTLYDKVYTPELIYDVEMYFFWSIPKSYNKPRKLDCLSGFEIPTKQDVDNCLKFYEDVCNGIIWQDDRYIRSSKGVKAFSTVPRTEIYWNEHNLKQAKIFGEKYEALKQIT